MLTLASKPDPTEDPRRGDPCELNWNRAVHVDGDIDDALVRRLTPEILRLRQASDAPITIGIDSNGGTVDSLHELQALLRNPDQRGRTCPIYTVALNHAESAAALLLASGDYAVAQPHASILMHDISRKAKRITGERAAEIARDLILDNHSHAQALAKVMLRRNLWVFAGLQASFQEERTRFPGWTKDCGRSFAQVAALAGPGDPGEFDLDLAGYAITLFNRLSSPVDKVVSRSVACLVWLFQCEALAASLGAPKALRKHLVAGYRSARRLLGEGAGKMLSVDEFREIKARGIERVVASILMRQAEGESFSISDSGLAPIERDYLQLWDFAAEGNDEALADITTRLRAFLPEGARARSSDAAPFLSPQALILWRFLGLINRRLFFGDNRLTAADAQLLGLVDEVLGGSEIASAGEVVRVGAGHPGARKRTTDSSSATVSVERSSSVTD